jgi:hypothetical protein
MEPDCSLLCPKEPTNGHYPKPDKSNPHAATIFLQVPFYCSPIYALIFPASSFFLFLLIKTLYMLLFSLICLTFPVNRINSDMIILIIFSEEYKPWMSSHKTFSVSRYFNPLSSKYSPQHPHFSWSTIPSFTPKQNHRRNYSRSYFNLYVLDSRREDKALWTEWYGGGVFPRRSLISSKEHRLTMFRNKMLRRMSWT